MTHLSPLSYPTRGVITMYMLAFAIFRVFYTDGGKIFSFDNIKTLQPRTLAAMYLFASMVLAIASDCLSSYFKYAEGSLGFMCKNLTSSSSYTTTAGFTFTVSVFSKASYTADDKVLVTNSDALLEAAFIAKISGFFLTLAALNRLSEKYVGATFMTMCEYRVYCLYSLASVPLYPILQGIYHDDATLSTVAPQVVYHFECLVLFILFAVMAVRMKLLLDEASGASEYGLSRMRYMIGVVCVLSFLNLLDGVGLGIINLNVLRNKVNAFDAVKNPDGIVLYTMFTLDALVTLFSFSFSPAYGVGFLVLVTDDDEELEFAEPVKAAAPVTAAPVPAVAVEMSAAAPAIPSNNPLSQ